MHLLIVEQSLAALESFSEQICSEALEELEVQIEVSIATPDRLDKRLLPCADVFLFGPALGDEAFAAAARAKKLSPHSLMIICSRSTGSVEELQAAHPYIYAVVPCVSLGNVLRQELLAIHLGAAEKNQPAALAGSLSKRYDVIRCLGHGSLGTVYACRHKEIAGQVVALKVLYPELIDDEQANARFRDEIVARYGVSHPNVIRAYEYTRDADFAAFTMEYAGGGSLHDRVFSGHPLSLPECVHILRQIASGLEAIHNAGFIHGDLTLKNVLFTEQGEVKVSDFGISKWSAASASIEHGGFAGTIDYVSPEYVKQGQVDSRSDIYALGLIAYQMITGAPAFKGESVIETMTMRLEADPQPPSTIRKSCPPGLDKVVLRAIHRDPEQRYQSAGEIVQALEGLCRC